jgi:ATP/maltotriose-dependent transcriptional regulator MalT
MLIRVLATLGVGVWCLFILLVSVVFVIDRGLADVGIVWIAILGIGVAAPALLLRQIDRTITTHQEYCRAVPGSEEREKDLLGVLEERGELTPATAAMRTSLTVEEASQMLEELARKGQLERRKKDDTAAYILSAADRRALVGKDPASSETAFAKDSEPPDEFVATERLDDPLSERELEVLSLLASGKTNSEVAADLFVSVGTIKSHTGNIYRKLGARNRAEALARARELGMLR